MAAQGHAVLHRAEADLRAVAGENAVGGLRENHVVTMGGVEREVVRRERHVVELGFVKHLEAAGRKRDGIGDGILLQVRLLVAQEPAGEAHACGVGVQNFNRVLQRRVGVRQQFVDHHVGQRQPVRIAETFAGREIHDARRAVGEAALRHAGCLSAEGHAVDERAVGLRESDSLAARRQAERNVIRAVLRLIVSGEFHKTKDVRADEGELGDLMFHPRAW